MDSLSGTDLQRVPVVSKLIDDSASEQVDFLLVPPITETKLPDLGFNNLNIEKLFIANEYVGVYFEKGMPHFLLLPNGRNTYTKIIPYEDTIESIYARVANGVAYIFIHHRFPDNQDINVLISDKNYLKKSHEAHKIRYQKATKEEQDQQLLKVSTVLSCFHTVYLNNKEKKIKQEDPPFFPNNFVKMSPPTNNRLKSYLRFSLLEEHGWSLKSEKPIQIYHFPEAKHLQIQIEKLKRKNEYYEKIYD